MNIHQRTKPRNATLASKILAKQRQLRAIELSAEGFTQAEIAGILRVSQPGVCKMLGRAYREALDRLQDLVLRMKLKQDRQLSMLFRENWLCWERAFAEDDTPAKLQYIDEMRTILEQQAKLWGLDGAGTPAVTKGISAGTTSLPVNADGKG